MVRNKGKAIAGSSSQDTGHIRKRRMVLQSDEEEEEEVQLGPKPTWTSGSLADKPSEWQAPLFHDKMNSLRNKAEGFVCEKVVRETDFGPFGITGRFKALGWEAALDCYDDTDKYLYMDEVQEWMATLRCPPYRKATEMKLIGVVKGLEVVMSFETLRQIARFDSKQPNKYVYPSLNDMYFQPERHPTWIRMLECLFVPNRDPKKLYRRDLKIEAKLLLTIILHNVMPRRGDLQELRYPEVPLLYALMNGTPLLSFRFLVLNNIWISRNKHDRKMVPHCRLITALLRLHGVIGEDDIGIRKRHLPFDVKRMGSIWEYSESERYYKLKSEGQSWRVLKENARPLQQGEPDEDEENEQEEEESEDEDVGPSEPVPMETEGAGMSRGSSRPRARRTGVLNSTPFDFANQTLNPNWAYGDSMREVIINNRPPQYYHWPEVNQAIFDQNTYFGASAERARKAQADRHEECREWYRANAFAFQQEINDRYVDDRNRRMHDAWHAGQPFVADPPIIDYTTLPPYDGSVSYPTPPLHHSRWVDPRQGETMQQPPPPSEGTSGQEEGAFGFGTFSNIFTDIFGPPQPPYH